MEKDNGHRFIHRYFKWYEYIVWDQRWRWYTWQSNSNNVINNECMVDACNNIFDTDKVNFLCIKQF